MKKKIAVLGATGRTGIWIVQEALQRGYAVNALVREQSSLNIEHNDLTIIKGTPTATMDLMRVMEGCEAVLSALNISRKNEWWPWSELSSSPTFLSDVAQKTVDVANQSNLKRCLVVTAWGTGETKQDIPGWFRFFINTTKIGVTYRDHERQEEIWAKSGLDWTIVRPVGLNNDTEEKPIGVLLESKTAKPTQLMISRRMVARFMLDALEENTYLHQKPIIFYT
ncbi:NAD(P)-dependent oxidoreductase [Salmonirosea aquatica]|uniref:NAD(P)H-binding protein n=1 Tax=Salmonirosea aquatica TaxID=2654236 RepID=A0A7C9F8M2_9BACT|nr:NAD(P)H-binding protein [Cytophagaceae bacterium SJW1-29]